MPLGDWKEKIKSAKDKVVETAGAVGKDQVKEKLAICLEELNDLRPLLKESGFIIGDVVVTISIPPSFGIIVEQEKNGVNKLEQVMEARKDELTKFQSLVMGSLKKLYDLNDMVERYEHTIGQIEVELGIPPKVRAHLNSNRSRSFTS